MVVFYGCDLMNQHYIDTIVIGGDYHPIPLDISYWVVPGTLED